MESPIFIFSTGWRTGSTLLQRLLNSHSDIMIWGENQGVVECLEQAGRIIRGIGALGKQHLQKYRKEGSMGWIAAMNPPEQFFQEGLRRLLETYYRDPSLEFGKLRWGFKEVRHGLATARFLTELYPSSRFLFLVRHPQACLASARATHTPLIKKGILHEVGGPRMFLEHWARIGASFLDDKAGIHHLILRYEDLLVDFSGTIHLVSRHIGVNPSDLDSKVMEVRRRGWLGQSPRLEIGDRQLLHSDWLWQVASQFGYVIDD